MITKTDTSEFDAIMEGMKEAVQYSEGTREGFVTHIPDAIDVRAVRAKTGLTQKRFAEVFGIGLATLRQWEQGRRQPRGPSRVLLHVIDTEPEMMLRALIPAEPKPEVSARSTVSGR